MFFLLRVAFWLSLVVLFIPADPQSLADKGEGRDVSTFEAIGAAQSTYSDLKGFCGRNPTTCDVGRMAANTFTAKAKTGVRWISEQLDGTSDKPSPTVTGSTNRSAPSTTPSELRPTLGWDAPLPPRRPIG